MRKVLCWLGIHSWIYGNRFLSFKLCITKLRIRTCEHCNQIQRPTSIMRGEWVNSGKAK